MDSFSDAFDVKHLQWAYVCGSDFVAIQQVSQAVLMEVILMFIL